MPNRVEPPRSLADDPRAMRRCVLLSACALLGFAVARADPTPASLDRVVELVRRHDDPGAIHLLERLPSDERGSSRALYLRARLLERTGRLGEAADGLDIVPGAELPEALADDLVLRRARLLARSGRCDRAMPELQRRAGAATAPALVRAWAGECALELGSHEDAARLLASVARDTEAGIDRVAVARALAQALDRLGRRDEATARLRDVLVDQPAHPDADSLRDELRARSTEAAAFDRELRIEVVARLLEARAHDRALAWLDEAGEPSDRALLARHLDLRGRILFAMRTRYPEAATTLERAARLGGPRALEDELMAARAMLRAGDEADAIARYDRFVRRHPRAPEAEVARFAAASIELRTLRPGAARRMQTFLADAGPRARGERIGEAHLLLAFFALGTGDAPTARSHLDAACARRPDRITRDGCTYFGARVDELAGAGSRARTAYRGLARSATHDWYGLLARRRLRELGDPYSSEAPTVPVPAPGVIPLPPEVEFLASIGLDEEAAERLRAHESDFGEPGIRGLAAKVRAHQRLGDHARAFRLARQGATATEQGDPQGDPGWHAFFVAAMLPRPHADLVEVLAPRLGVDVAYVYGTMRQESGFDPAAVSRVGAIGLLQLMPSTAARAASRAGLDFDATQLFDARTNVQVALAEMSELSRRRHGHIVLVAASYNAGVAATDEWLGKRRQLPLDLFVEWIPFDETRGYVRRVVGHAARYRAAMGEPEAGLDYVSPLPEGLP